MKKFLISVASIILCFVFSGCNVLEMDTEALMKPPVFTEEQEKLNAALTEVIGESYVLKYPEIGEPNPDVIQYLIEQQQQGAKIILWTCRAGLRLGEAVSWCRDLGLFLDAINENAIEAVMRFGWDTRKIYADEYIDDKMSTKFKLPYRGGVESNEKENIER